jgi:hypothetical protein
VDILQSDGTTYTPATCNVASISCMTGCTCTVAITSLKTAPYNLANGANVFAKVLAKNAVGSSAYSSAGNGAVLLSEPSIPAAPTTAVSGTDVTVTWNAPTNGGSTITGYTVAILQKDGTTYTPATCTVNSISCTTSCTCSIPIETLQAIPYSITAGARVSAKVLAKNAVGNSAYSPGGDGAAIPLVITVPAAPFTIPTQTLNANINE